MAYIHVKRIGGRNYYTLRVSARKGEQVVTKDICSLGNDISKISLDKLERQYHDEIRKSYKTIRKFLDSSHYLQKAKEKGVKADDYFSMEQALEIGAIHSHFHSKFLKLDKLTRAEIMENFLINFAVNSTSIEGNTITPKQARILLTEGIMPANKTAREAYDLTNTKKAWNFLNENKQDIGLALAETVHDMLLEDIDIRKGFRTHDIRIYGQPFKPSPARYAKDDTKIIIKWHLENKDKMHPLALAAFFHHKFEHIHPFSDGNGRTGRMLMNQILMLSGYPPIVISRRFRKEYLNAMNKADESLRKGLTACDSRHYRHLLDFIVKQYKMSYWDIFLV